MANPLVETQALHPRAAAEFGRSPAPSGRLSRGSDARLTPDFSSCPYRAAQRAIGSANDVNLVLDDYRLVDGPKISSAQVSYCLRLSALAIRSA